MERLGIPLPTESVPFVEDGAVNEQEIFFIVKRRKTALINRGN